MQYSESDKMDMSRQECLNRICTALSGRAAEKHFFGNEGITTGASEDIRSATELATQMVSIFGMEDDMLFFIEPGKTSENADVLDRVRNILSEQYKRASHMVGETADKIEKVATALIQHESLTDMELVEIVS